MVNVGDHALIKICAVEYLSLKTFLQDKQD
jgi:hypothetical protein